MLWIGPGSKVITGSLLSSFLGSAAGAGAAGAGCCTTACCTAGATSGLGAGVAAVGAGATGTLTITTPKDKTYTIAINETKVEGENPLNVVRKPVTEQGKTNYYFYFTPTERGHYEATYVAEDLAGNKSKAQVIDVYVGDTEVPLIYLTSDLEN